MQQKSFDKGRQNAGFSGLFASNYVGFKIFKNISFLVFSAICFSYCAFAETAILFIEKKARKHINRRLKILNKSLERTVRRFPQDELFLEKRKFEREYKFLEKK